jgi:hypothetical protein
VAALVEVAAAVALVEVAAAVALVEAAAVALAEVAAAVALSEAAVALSVAAALSAVVSSNDAASIRHVWTSYTATRRFLSFAPGGIAGAISASLTS